MRWFSYPPAYFQQAGAAREIHAGAEHESGRQVQTAMHRVIAAWRQPAGKRVISITIVRNHTHPAGFRHAADGPRSGRLLWLALALHYVLSIRHGRWLRGCSVRRVPVEVCFN